ncbi:MAG: hypothetical protein M1828_007494 [Chrysothrix sp. TS-e1954]|nr:MAG: hypothetical protein M1828_007494 [Chrysothrix sp. TS-e1954]
MTSPKQEIDSRTESRPVSSPPHPFGSQIPFAEPAWYNSLHSPYYNSSHRALRSYIRSYVDRYILPHWSTWEAAGEAPRNEALRYAQSGIPFSDVPLVYRPKDFETVGPVAWKDLDAFHMLVMVDEGARVQGGVTASLAGGSVIGIPPVINHGTEEQKRRWLPGLFDWTTSFCLGITEPTGGSDVSAIVTKAVKNQSGTHYTVNGHKKWITGSPWATHMTTAVRTGGEGLKGISLLVIPLDSPGVSIRKIQNSGQNAGGSSWVSLENVQVPVDHLLGRENTGFAMIMTNFNKERFIMAISCNRQARTCLSTALGYSMERETFGKPLMSHQVIRHKITDMARFVESHWAWLEQLAFQIQQVGWQAPDIAGRVALAKVHGGRILEMAAREAQQVLGGAGYQRSGVGAQVEQITRDLRMMVVGGGSEEILNDLAFRQEMAIMEKKGSKL